MESLIGINDIWDYADYMFLAEQAKKVNRDLSVLDLTYDKSLKDRLSQLLPTFNIYGSTVKGIVENIETNGKEESKNEYYPQGSFYHISITYTIKVEKKPFFFQKCTVHFSKEMEFISVQGHQKEGMNEIMEQISQVFRKIVDDSSIE